MLFHVWVWTPADMIRLSERQTKEGTREQKAGRKGRGQDKVESSGKLQSTDNGSRKCLLIGSHSRLKYPQTNAGREATETERGGVNVGETEPATADVGQVWPRCELFSLVSIFHCKHTRAHTHGHTHTHQYAAAFPVCLQNTNMFYWPALSNSPGFAVKQAQTRSLWNDMPIIGSAHKHSSFILVTAKCSSTVLSLFLKEWHTLTPQR